MRCFLAAALLALSAVSADAHEFWIQPRNYQVEAGAPIIADLFVGERFGGVEFAYLPDRFRRFEVVNGEQVEAVRGRLGDRPALQQAPTGVGLNVVALVTEDARLTYDDYDSFRDFVTHKDAEWVLSEHAARGLSREDVTETYSRHVKALVAAETAEGADRPLGLEVEIVALANPYSGELEELPVRVLYRGAPRVDAQIEVFERAPDGVVSVSTLQTDAAGEALIPVAPGHEYLVDSVVLRPAAEVSGAMWESLWAALTFRMPD